MPYPIENKLVIAVSSSALFNLMESDSIFQAQGEKVYRAYQQENVNVPFERGVAFPFIKRLLTLNSSFPEQQPVEVILFSRNSPETGLRAFRSIQYYGLAISRACFSSGKNNFQYLPAFNASLFLSANPKDTKAAIESGYAAGTVLNSKIEDNDSDNELRIGFDFDGVLADDTSEQVYNKVKGDMEKYFEHEKAHAADPLSEGPICKLLQKISYFQKLEKKKCEKDKTYTRILHTAIITARNAPAHERVITTLKNWDVEVDEAFFLGGIDKASVLNIMKPHIFFDDQIIHLDHLDKIPAVHIPFGVANR